MKQTMAEKLFSRKNKAGTPAMAGDIVEARLDGVMCHYGFFSVTQHAIKAGFPEGIPKVFDKNKVYVLIDHHQPSLSQQLADRAVVIRKAADRLAVNNFHDSEPGISHQMMIDNRYARPGELIVGTDSHTIGYGCVNAASTGMSQIEAVYAVMYGELWFEVPRSIRVTLSGHYPNYPISKDIILYLAGKYGDDFGTGMSIEYDGPLVSQMSIDSRMCISTQGVDVGATFSLFPFDAKTEVWLGESDGRPHEVLTADAGANYEKEIELNVDDMPFVVSKPHRLGNVAPVEEVKNVKIQQAQIGSCANGRYEDIEIAARMLRGRKVAKGVRFIVSPASQGVYLKCLETGVAKAIVEAGGHFVTPGCGVCQPMVGFMSAGETCITSTTRNYRGRKGSMDANLYLGGPLTVVAAAVAGQIAHPKEVFHEL
jgi:3-isopropylmalate/(R)-2-methylmalate dehydratase large subunit